MPVDLAKSAPNHLAEAEKWADKSAEFFKKSATYVESLQFDQATMSADYAKSCLNMAADHYALHRHSISLQDIEK